MLVINATGDSWPEARKRALLLHCLGSEGQRLFYTLPNSSDTLADAIKALEEHLIPKRMSLWKDILSGDEYKG